MASSSSSSTGSIGCRFYTSYDPEFACRDTSYVSSGLFTDDYYDLLTKVSEVAKSALFPEPYKDRIVQPFSTFLRRLGEDEFKRIIQSPPASLTPTENRTKFAIKSFAEAILHQNPKICPTRAFKDLEAFQALVSDIHRVLSLERPSGLAPLAFWTKENGHSPQTIWWKEIDARVTCLHPAYRHAGLLAWSAIGHEIGHDFLQNQEHLKGIFKLSVESEVKKINEDENVKFMATYLSNRIDELASDVLGVLSMGPSSAIGFIHFMRAIRGGSLLNRGPKEQKAIRLLGLTWGSNTLEINLEKPLKGLEGEGQLGRERTGNTPVKFVKQITPGDTHPIEILRPYAMLAIVNLLKIDELDKLEWKQIIEYELKKETDGLAEVKFVTSTSLEDWSSNSSEISYKSIPFDLTVQAIEKAALAIALTKIKEDQSLYELVCWSELDETITLNIRQTILTFQSGLFSGTKARHIVSGAILESLEGGVDCSKIFENMKEMLRQLSHTQIIDIDILKEE